MDLYASLLPYIAQERQPDTINFLQSSLSILDEDNFVIVDRLHLASILTIIKSSKKFDQINLFVSKLLNCYRGLEIDQLDEKKEIYTFISEDLIGNFLPICPDGVIDIIKITSVIEEIYYDSLTTEPLGFFNIKTFITLFEIMGKQINEIEAALEDVSEPWVDLGELLDESEKSLFSGKRPLGEAKDSVDEPEELTTQDEALISEDEELEMVDQFEFLIKMIDNMILPSTPTESIDDLFLAILNISVKAAPFKNEAIIHRLYQLCQKSAETILINTDFKNKLIESNRLLQIHSLDPLPIAPICKSFVNNLSLIMILLDAASLDLESPKDLNKKEMVELQQNYSINLNQHHNIHKSIHS
jgi:hypothetical protein